MTITLGESSLTYLKLELTSTNKKIYSPNMYILEELSMQVSKWGNSLAIRLPVSVVDALQLHEGDDIEVTIADERVFNIRKKPGNEALFEKLRQYRGRLPADFKFDRNDANARG